MSQEFMFYIRNAKDAKLALSSVEHLEFIRKCELYIGRLKAEGKLIAAQPLVREGFVLTRNNEEWKTTAVNSSDEIQVGYYHIIAGTMDEAIAMAKENPEFEYVPSASIEVRPVKMKEEKTNFVYPNDASK